MAMFHGNNVRINLFRLVQMYPLIRSSTVQAHGDREEGSYFWCVYMKNRHGKSRHREKNGQIADDALHIRYLNSKSYTNYVLNPEKGIVTMILLVDNTTNHGQHLLKTYGKVLSKHRYGNLHLFFLCYHKNRAWFEELLARTSTLERQEAEWRLKGCVSGRVATAMLLFGAKKQLVLFPDDFEVVRQLCVGGGEGGGREGDTDDDVLRQDRSISKNSLSSAKTRAKNSNKTVGNILGSTLGYESSDENTESDSFEDGDDHLSEERGLSESSREGSPTHGNAVRHRHSRPASNRTHQPHPLSAEECHSSLVEQVCGGFENWCDRLADGSLRRHSVEAWPDWT